MGRAASVCVAAAVLCVFVCRAAMGADNRWHISTQEELFQLFDTDVGSFVSEDVVMDADITVDLSETTPLGVTSNGDCVAFRGTFDGNNHIISGLKVSANSGNAGLFCGLVSGTVKNVVFDETCSFDGMLVGSVCGTVSGNGVVMNVHNKAAVHCSSSCGGLVSAWASTTSLDISHSTNTGSVTGESSTYTVHVGGFVGSASFGENVLMSHNTNNGTVTCQAGSCGAGGFVGYLYTVGTISHSTNNGNVTSEATMATSIAGGFVGYNRYTLISTNNTNNGNITATGGSSTCVAGGIVGQSEERDTVKLTDTMNTGTIVATSSPQSSHIGTCGGLIGHLVNGNGENVEVLNCANRGNVSSNFQAFGIAPAVSKAINVVSLGVLGEGAAYATWESCSGETEENCDTNVFVGVDVCSQQTSNCTATNGIQIEWDNTTQVFVTVDGGRRVDELLNKQVEDQGFSRLWTSTLFFC